MIDFSENRRTELVTVPFNEYMNLNKKRDELDLLIKLLWEDVVGLSPNGEDLDFEPVMAQWFLKNYRGFEYEVYVEKLKERKRNDTPR